ncbi:MAG: helix-turn-helix transcriptional regulator [Candidatus Bathyarchaeota archaeon]|nr:helix-turn-helix transcriptional regulator [Candidatus Bathyarchaeota archaeon]
MRDKIISQPGYWVEQINSVLYDAIIDFMETHNMKRKDLAKHLGISKGRVSQIINDGEINFRLEKIIEISLKLGMVPHFELENKNEFLEKEQISLIQRELANFQNFFTSCKEETRVIQLNSHTENVATLQAEQMSENELLAETY